MQMFFDVLEYFSDGGHVSVALLLLFFMITYTIGYRFAVLFNGRNINIRKYFLGDSNLECVQDSFLKSIQTIQDVDREKLIRKIDFYLLTHEQKINMYSDILNTAVLLAPLLGLLGTVIGMIETFSSLGDADLFSSSGGIAGGISQALLTTQLGLVVAIPGMFLSRYLKKIERKTHRDFIQLRELYLQKEGVL